MNSTLIAFTFSVLSVFSSQSYADELSAYLDCHFLALEVSDAERAKQYMNKAFEIVEDELPEEEEAHKLLEVNFYYRKGIIKGAIKATSFRLGISVYHAIQKINEEPYCKYHQWDY